MKKAICTTTINAPTLAIQKFIGIAQHDGWDIYIAGDKKTPHRDYFELENSYSCVHYLTPQMQEESAKLLSIIIGWNCIQRRNFSMLAAYRDGTEIMALVDDDNIPITSIWGHNVKVGKSTECHVHDCGDRPVFEPLGWGEGVWHRGYPVQLLPGLRTGQRTTVKVRTPLVQADLWDGAPDIDAVSRIAGGDGKAQRFARTVPYAGSKPGPFNSQNTFIHRSILPTYFLYPGVGRMDDIWASYVMQRVFPDSVIYGPPTVRQDRNVHDLVSDLEAEMLGYKYTMSLVSWLEDHDPIADPWPEWMPARALAAWAEWRRVINNS